jgi:hypothetical protein
MKRRRMQRKITETTSPILSSSTAPNELVAEPNQGKAILGSAKDELGARIGHYPLPRMNIC